MINLTDPPIIKLKQYGMDEDGKFYSGVDISCGNVYSPCYGAVIDEFKSDQTRYGVILQYSEHICLKFSHLKETHVHKGMLVKLGDMIGIGDKFCKFEYLTTESSYPSVKSYILPGIVFYTHDPNIILDGNVIFDNTHTVDEGITLFGETLEELSNNRGD